MNVKLDSVVIGAEESTFLQQAAHISNGFYQRIQSSANLLQLLLMFYMTLRPVTCSQHPLIQQLIPALLVYAIRDS